MIIKAAQRGDAPQLAAYLLNERKNDHVTLYDVRGFVSGDLHEAFAEAHAVAKGTKCQQYLFSVSLNPPKGAQANERDFEKAADAAEKALGLTGQPRAIVFHENEGRRHAHVVWSRIDAATLKAINLSHFKYKLTALSKELYLEHGWELPEGLRLNGGTNPLNYTLEQYQQAKRVGLDPREIKDAFRAAWKQSDNVKALRNALEERGYFLAKGDRRGLVALDVHGEVYSVARYVGIKTDDMRHALGEEGSSESLPTVDDTRRVIASRVCQQLKTFQQETRESQAADMRPLRMRSDELRDEHRDQRARLKTKQAERWQAETDARAQRLRTGLAGLWDMLSGKAATLKQQNAVEAYEAARRDQMQRDRLVFDQMDERRGVQQRIDKMRLRHVQERKDLHRDLMAHMRRQDHRDGIEEPPLKPRAHERGFTLER